MKEQTMNMNDKAVREMTSHPRWVSSLYEFVAPHWDNLVNGQWAQSVATARLSVEQMQGGIRPAPPANVESGRGRYTHPAGRAVAYRLGVASKHQGFSCRSGGRDELR